MQAENQNPEHNEASSAVAPAAKTGWLPRDFHVALLPAVIGALVTVVVGFLVYLIELKDSQITQVDNRLGNQITKLEQNTERMSSEISTLRQGLEAARAHEEAIHQETVDRMAAYQYDISNLADHVLFIYRSSEDSVDRWRAEINKKTPAVQTNSSAMNLLPHHNQRPALIEGPQRQR